MKLVRGVLWSVGLVAVVALAGSVCAEEVSFKSLDGTRIKAQLFHPGKQPPRGTVVALHGCGGLYAPHRKGQLNARHQAAADMLTAQGYAVVFPDSLTTRGEDEICTQSIGKRLIDQAKRRSDALAAMFWVASQPWARADRIALLGWSSGGSAVLSATDASRDAQMSPVRPVVAVAFYPGCRTALKSGYRSNTRLVMLVAEKDDWTPPGPCIELGQRAGAEVIVYPDSYHGFDNPFGQVRLRTDVPNGLNPGQGVHVGRNPVAAWQANARVLELLREAFP
ncbi:MAG TPA: dienelactone hydrolase family protein [Burkholderiales bacterium]|nr:dienelactone hydrolase family protein [Burkholderiales bacterium]